MIFHVEVHSRDRVIEHYIVPNAESEKDAAMQVRQFYADKGQRLGMWDRESDKNDIRIPYLIFAVNELPTDPVIYIAGEYRSQFPI